MGVVPVSQEFHVQVRFYPPPADLQRYFTTFYHMEWSVPGGGRIAGSAVQALDGPEGPARGR